MNIKRRVTKSVRCWGVTAARMVSGAVPGCANGACACSMPALDAKSLRACDTAEVPSPELAATIAGIHSRCADGGILRAERRLTGPWGRWSVSPRSGKNHDASLRFRGPQREPSARRFYRGVERRVSADGYARAERSLDMVGGTLISTGGRTWTSLQK